MARVRILPCGEEASSTSGVVHCYQQQHVPTFGGNIKSPLRPIYPLPLKVVRLVFVSQLPIYLIRTGSFRRSGNVYYDNELKKYLNHLSPCTRTKQS